MSGAQLTLIYFGSTLLALVVVGLVVRGRVAVCWAFFVHILATMTCALLIALWPQQFFVFSFYSMKETALFVLTVLVAVEIWLRSFSTFPRARVRVGLAFVATLLATAVAVNMIPPGLHPYDELLGILCARQQAGTLVLVTVLLSAAGWYRIPIHPLHRAILIGYAAYLAVFTFALSVMGWQAGSPWAYRWFAPLPPIAYTITEVAWVRAAWRPMRRPSATISRLQPWATSW